MTLQQPSISLSQTQHQTENIKAPNTTMSQQRFIFRILLCLALVQFHTHIPICNGLSFVDLNLLKHSEMAVMTKRVCTKSIGECLTEPEMDSETNRRVLIMEKKYISYGTLKRDMVPCDRAGASYYNCHARQANPYNRGCEVITGCARGVQAIKT
ncbi:protein RALF-like 24 [Gastrolobium bilobum]|uniref:protein RALF-like 24 n=1 Tax=Gastrolobium bilobum TaxID=150636 RepID=UPI002AB15F5E|nr:protein RALF-like 24 [Gastrolobium bilobum]